MMMMQVTKAGDFINVGTEHLPPVGAWVTIAEGDVELNGRVETIEYEFDGNQIPAAVRLRVMLA